MAPLVAAVLSRGQAQVLQQQLEAHFDTYLKKTISWVSAVVKNHTLPLKVLDAPPGETERVADTSNSILSETNLFVNNEGGRAAV